MNTTRTIRIGTRGSVLARTQSCWVAAQLVDRGVSCQVITISTAADRSSAPIASFGTQGVFTKEIQQALLRDEIDIAVHSMKDLPTLDVPGLAWVSSPQRVDPRDALITQGGDSLEALPNGSRVGTGSLRRKAQLLAARPDLEVVPIRGNVDTRLAKVTDREVDGVILAVAGLKRLDREDAIRQILPPESMLPAVGQGALALEIREDDEGTREAADLLNDLATYRSVQAERAMLRTLQGGCLAPVAAWAQPQPDSRLALQAAVLSPDGSRRIDTAATGTWDEAEALGISVAETLLHGGAAELIESSRSGRHN